MTRNEACVVTSTRRYRMNPGIRTLVLTGFGLLLLLTACAKKPEIVATAPPPTAAGTLAKEPGEQGPFQPPGKPGTPGVGSPSAPGADGPLGGGPGGPLAGKPLEEGGGPEAGNGGAGLKPSAPLPPGTEAIAPPPSPPREEPLPQVAQATGKESPLKDIFFDFDKSEIRQDAKASLMENVRWLRDHPGAAITIEGHCDERGTSEYNLGLGERRAKATKDYLISSAIDPRRIVTVSYGKERPFVLGHDESAWKWNRRGHFVVTKE